MKRLLAAALVSIYAVTAFASDVRVTTMGRGDDFFMDDMSIYRNPANVSIYPNMVLGCIGTYGEKETVYDTVKTIFADSTQNYITVSKTEKSSTPQKPYFGGIVSFSLDKSQENVKQYPMFSLGAVLNRYDEKLGYLDPKNDNFIGAKLDSTGESFGLVGKAKEKAENYERGTGKIDILDPLGKVDVMASLALKSGAMVGAGIYFALNNEEINDVVRKTSLVKGNVGVNLPVSKTIDVEASANIGIMSLIALQDDDRDTLYPTLKNGEDTLMIADNDVFFDADVRVFSGLSGVNGDLVPTIGAKFAQFHGGDNRLFGFNAGIGLNLYIDRGFFWLGAMGEFEDNDYKYIEDGDNDERNNYKDVKEISAKISFGIERNILWDWFVIRAGGTKKLINRNVSGESTILWKENAESDASDDDHLGVGIGVNVENRLKIDLTLAEDIFYTFSNLFSGDSPHLFTKISASFSF